MSLSGKQKVAQRALASFLLASKHINEGFFDRFDKSSEDIEHEAAWGGFVIKVFINALYDNDARLVENGVKTESLPSLENMLIGRNNRLAKENPDHLAEEVSSIWMRFVGAVSEESAVLHAGKRTSIAKMAGFLGVPVDDMISFLDVFQGFTSTDFNALTNGAIFSDNAVNNGVLELDVSKSVFYGFGAKALEKVFRYCYDVLTLLPSTNNANFNYLYDLVIGDGTKEHDGLRIKTSELENYKKDKYKYEAFSKISRCPGLIDDPRFNYILNDVLDYKESEGLSEKKKKERIKYNDYFDCDAVTKIKKDPGLIGYSEVDSVLNDVKAYKEVSALTDLKRRNLKKRVKKIQTILEGLPNSNAVYDGDIHSHGAMQDGVQEDGRPMLERCFLVEEFVDLFLGFLGHEEYEDTNTLFVYCYVLFIFLFGDTKYIDDFDEKLDKKTLSVLHGCNVNEFLHAWWRDVCEGREISYYNTGINLKGKKVDSAKKEYILKYIDPLFESVFSSSFGEIDKIKVNDVLFEKANEIFVVYLKAISEEYPDELKKYLEV